MYKLILQNDKGEEIPLKTFNYIINNIEGLTSSISEVSTANSFYNVGGRITNIYIPKRLINISILFKYQISYTINFLQRSLPVGRYLTVKITTKEKNVYIKGILSEFTISRFEPITKGFLTIDCPLPYFIDATPTIKQDELIDKKFYFPYFCEDGTKKPVGIYKLKDNIIINNVGDVKSGAFFELVVTDSLNNIILTNLTTQQIMRINYNFIKNDIIKINTYKGEKSIKLLRNGIITDIIQYWDSSTEWLEIDIGENEFIWDSSNLKIKIVHNNLYQMV